jgi:hypothetical protein
VNRSYRAQIFAVDLLALSMAATVAAADVNHGAFALPIGTFMFGGPTVHLIHGNWGRATGSFSLRLLPPILYVTAARNSDCPTPESDPEGDGGATCRLPGQMLLAASVVAVMLVDSLVLGRKVVDVTPELAPVATVMSDGGWAGITGRF